MFLKYFQRVQKRTTKKTVKKEQRGHSLRQARKDWQDRKEKKRTYQKNCVFPMADGFSPKKRRNGFHQKNCVFLMADGFSPKKKNGPIRKNFVFPYGESFSSKNFQIREFDPGSG